MCRMIAFSASEDIPIQPFLDHLLWMASSGKRAPHPHGWGYFVLNASGFASVVKSQRPIFVDVPKSQLKASVGLFHARKASKGTAINLDNAHPYVIFNGSLHVLAHNGGIEDVSEQESEGLSTGVDSEMILRNIVEFGVEEGYRRLCRRRTSSLTFFYYFHPRLYALRHCTRLCDYYTLFYKVKNGTVLVSSEPISEGWEELGVGELLVLERGSILDRRVIECT